MGRSRCASLVVLVALPCVAACEAQPIEPERISLTIVSGGRGGAFYPLAVALADVYRAELPEVETHVESGGSGRNVQAVQDGRAQLAFTQADVAYLAYRHGTEADPRPYTELRGIAVLWQNTVQLAVRRASAIRAIPDLRGRHVSVGTPGSGSETLAHTVLESYGLSYEDLHPEFLSFSDSMARMRDGSVDAMFVSAGVPIQALSELSLEPGLRFLSIPRAHVTSLRGQYPFMQPLVVPGGTYRGLDRDLETMGVSNLLVCRRDLDENLVYELTRALFDALPRLAAREAVARLIDVDNAPATPIPLHAGAARYYREREIAQ